MLTKFSILLTLHLLLVAVSAIDNATQIELTSNSTQASTALETTMQDSLRLGLRTGVVTTNGWNSGGYSSSQVTGIGGQAGIMRNDGSYKPMYNQAFLGGHTYQRGRNPPDSYGVVTNQLSPGSVRGSEYGNVNNAYRKNVYTFDTSAQSIQPLGGGSYLWSGLKPSKPANDTKTESTDHPKN